MARASLVRALGLPLGVACSLVATAVVLSHGRQGYAAFTLVLSVISLLPVADLGLGAALTTVTSARATDPRAFDGTLLASLRWLLVSTTTLVAVAVLLLQSGAWSSVTGGLVTGPTAVGASLALAVFACSLPLGAGQRLLIGEGGSSTWASLQALQGPLNLLLVWSLSETGRPELFCVAPVLSTWCVVAAAAAVAVRRTGVDLSALAVKLPRPRRHPGARVLPQAAPMLVVMLAHPLAVHSDRLIIANTPAVAHLPEYSLAAQFFNPVLAIASTAGMALWPVYARRRARSEQAGPVPDVLRFLLAASITGALVVAVAPWAARLLSEGSVEVPLELLVAFAVATAVQAAQLPLGMYLTDRAGLRRQARWISVMLAVNLALSVAGVLLLGPVGPVAATAVAVLSCQVVPAVRHVTRGTA